MKGYWSSFVNVLLLVGIETPSMLSRERTNGRLIYQKYCMYNKAEDTKSKKTSLMKCLMHGIMRLEDIR